jgi:uncharacterized protein (DUF2252 family)
MLPLSFGSKPIFAAMISLDPVRLAKRQIEIDQDRVARFPHLMAHKVARMGASPLAMLRGSAPLFYEILEGHPALSAGPPGDGWLVGDAHLENFGAYRPDPLSTDETRVSRSKETVAFDCNDFDDAFVGPWRYDLLRLMTSLVLGGREMGADGLVTLKLCDRLIDAYVRAACGRARSAPLPHGHAIEALVEKVRSRTRKELLDARTEVVRGERRFVRGARYESLSRKLRAKADRAFQKFAKKLVKAHRVPAEALEVVDTAFRVAGTGSLGCLRVAVLVRGKGGRDGAWIFDMKEEGTPSAAGLVRPPRLEPAERVVAANRACLARPPRMLGSTNLRGSSMLVRRLAPQEDKLDLTKLATADLEPLARHLGSLLGAAHRRGAKRPPKKPWSDKDRARVLHQAVTLAGAHEAIYLAYCDAVRR